MSIKTVLSQRLKRYPVLYRLATKIYFGLEPYHLLSLLIGTRAETMKWARRSIGEGYWDNRNHPSKQFLVDRIAALAPFSKVLEVGCASGPNLYLLAKKFPQVEITGIDVNIQAIKYGTQQFAKEGMLNVRLLVSKAADLEFPAASFDVVFTSALLIYIGPDKIEKTIQDMLRVTRKALILMECNSFEPAKDATGIGIYRDGIWMRDYTALLKRFVPEEQIRVNRLPKDIWPVEPWRSCGAIIEVIKR